MGRKRGGQKTVLINFIISPEEGATCVTSPKEGATDALAHIRGAHNDDQSG